MITRLAALLKWCLFTPPDVICPSNRSQYLKTLKKSNDEIKSFLRTFIRMINYPKIIHFEKFTLEIVKLKIILMVY